VGFAAFFGVFHPFSGFFEHFFCHFSTHFHWNWRGKDKTRKKSRILGDFKCIFANDGFLNAVIMDGYGCFYMKKQAFLHFFCEKIAQKSKVIKKKKLLPTLFFFKKITDIKP
jgi:Na+/melibiose symporter-like transporter